MLKPKDETTPIEGVDTSEDETENEVLRESRLAKSFERDEHRTDGVRSRVGWKTAAGIGVGSAAVLAALLYARSGRK